MKPRIAVVLVIAYGAGLATGLSHFLDPLSAVLILVLGLAGLRAWPVLRLACAAALLGLAAGMIARADDQASCASRWPPRRLRVTVRALDPAFGAGIGRGRPEAGCRGAVRVRWRDADTVAAGDRIRVEGRWVGPDDAGRGSGVLVVAAARRVGTVAGTGDRLRTAAARAVRRLYGVRSGLVGALVLNLRGDIDPDVRDRFAQSGLVHILTISGFHVGLIAAWLVLLARLAGARRPRALALGALGAGAYVAWLGWPAPATRAAALATLLALSYGRQRHVQANAMLAVSCLVVMLVDPHSVVALGPWLSAAALWGAARFTRWSDRAVGSGYWVRTLFASIGATLATAPFTAAMLGAVAPIGIVMNFAAIPLAAVAIPGVLAGLVAAPLWTGLSAALAAGSGLALHSLELTARLGSAVPGGHAIADPGLGTALPWAAALGAIVWALGRRNTGREALRRVSLVLASASWVVLLARDLPATDAAPGLTLHFLDVGQGDAAVIRTPGGHWLLIDAGPVTGGADAGRRIVAPFLARHGVGRLSAVIVSHAHADHVGGAAAVLDRIPADVAVEPGELYADPVYYRFLDAVAADGVPWRVGRSGDRFALDGVSFTFLHPDTTWTEWHADLNEDSIVLRVEYGAFSVLFAGDAGLHAEARMAGHVGPVDLLKVGHHGSRGATGDAWLDELRPRVAVVSVGARNRYGHPSAEALRRLSRHGVDVWRTDREGTVTVVSDGHRMTVRGRRGATTYSVE